MFYLKFTLISLWFVLSCLLGLFYSLAFWGNLNINQRFARLYSWGVLKILGVQIQVEGLEFIQRDSPAIYIANHQSNLDMAIFGGIYPKRTVVIGKKEVAWIPLFGLFYMAAGNILIDRKRTQQAVAGLNQAVEVIKQKCVSIWMFPEGTRNREQVSLLPFKKGAFHMAVQAQIPVIPLIAQRLKTRVDWKRRKLSPGILKVKILSPIETLGLTPADVERLVIEVQLKMEEAFLGLNAQRFS